MPERRDGVSRAAPFVIRVVPLFSHHTGENESAARQEGTVDDLCQFRHFGLQEARQVKLHLRGCPEEQERECVRMRFS